MQGGCENFLSGASDHCTSTRRERRRKIFCKADAGDFLNIVLNYYNRWFCLIFGKYVQFYHRAVFFRIWDKSTSILEIS
jgi:hypothetical protein